VSTSLVTGATGFLGSHLARLLAASGDRVRVLVRPTSDLARLGGLDVDLVRGDVTDRASVEAALDDVDRVFHAAAHLEFGPADPTRMETVNVGGTEHVLGAASARRILAVHVSSVAALGPTGDEPVDEDHWSEDVPQVAYERTKRDAHLVARRLAADGAPVRIALPGGIYGWGDDSELYRIIQAYVRYPVPVGYLPEVVQSTVNVDDCAAGLVAIADHGEDGGEYILSAETPTLAEWFEYFCGAAGRRPPSVYVPTRSLRSLGRMLDRLAALGVPGTAMGAETIALACRHSAYSGARARAELGWSPRTLVRGMEELVAADLADREAERIRRARRSVARAVTEPRRH
jgi:nucleoside-diphosphate-sugar epimerase